MLYTELHTAVEQFTQLTSLAVPLVCVRLCVCAIVGVFIRAITAGRGAAAALAEGQLGLALTGFV